MFCNGSSPIDNRISETPQTSSYLFFVFFSPNRDSFITVTKLNETEICVCVTASTVRTGERSKQNADVVVDYKRIDTRWLIFERAKLPEF